MSRAAHTRISGSTDPHRALDALQKATTALANAAADPEPTLRLALELLIDSTGADAGAVAVPGDAGELPRLLAQQALEEAGPISMTVLETALAEQQEQATISEPPASASVLAS